MSTATPIRILIIDDHPLIRTATTLILNTHQRLRVIAEAADGLSAIKLARELNPDVALSDINMQPIDGIETTRRLLSILPELVVIGFSALPYPHQEKSMMEAGAVGVIHKSASKETICTRIIELYDQSIWQNRWYNQ